MGGKNNHPRFTARFGPVAVIIALFIGLVSFLIFSGYTPIAPTDSVVLGLFVANILGILLVFGFVLAEAYALFKARRANLARFLEPSKPSVLSGKWVDRTKIE